MKRYSLLIIFLMLYASLATSTRAQTTVAMFDTIDLTQPNPLTFQILLLGSSSATIGSTTFQVIKAMFPAAATGINAKIVLWKATSTIKTFDLGLTP